MREVPAGELRVGDVVLVRSGSRVPADGRIIEGEAELDESMITGESRSVPKGPGARVVAGTISTDSAIRVEVQAVGDDTTLAGIQRLVAEAQSSRSRAQALADRFAALNAQLLRRVQLTHPPIVARDANPVTGMTLSASCAGATGRATPTGEVARSSGVANKPALMRREPAGFGAAELPSASTLSAVLRGVLIGDDAASSASGRSPIRQRHYL